MLRGIFYALSVVSVVLGVRVCARVCLYSVFCISSGKIVVTYVTKLYKFYRCAGFLLEETHRALHYCVRLIFTFPPDIRIVWHIHLMSPQCVWLCRKIREWIALTCLFCTGFLYQNGIEHIWARLVVFLSRRPIGRELNNRHIFTGSRFMSTKIKQIYSTARDLIWRAGGPTTTSLDWTRNSSNNYPWFLSSLLQLSSLRRLNGKIDLEHHAASIHAMPI